MVVHCGQVDPGDAHLDISSVEIQLKPVQWEGKAAHVKDGASGFKLPV